MSQDDAGLREFADKTAKAAQEIGKCGCCHAMGWKTVSNIIYNEMKRRLVPAPGGGGVLRDAARWQALMNCPRIRLYGSAGVDPETGERTDGNHVHFGADFWSYGQVSDTQSGSKVTAWAKHCLIALADGIRGEPTPPVPSGDGVLVTDEFIGGAYDLPDGRQFWIDGPVAREIARRINEGMKK